MMVKWLTQEHNADVPPRPAPFLSNRKSSVIFSTQAIVFRFSIAVDKIIEDNFLLQNHLLIVGPLTL